MRHKIGLNDTLYVLQAKFDNGGLTLKTSQFSQLPHEACFKSGENWLKIISSQTTIYICETHCTNSQILTKLSMPKSVKHNVAKSLLYFIIPLRDYHLPYNMHSCMDPLMVFSSSFWKIVVSAEEEKILWEFVRLRSLFVLYLKYAKGVRCLSISHPFCKMEKYTF